jgi:hypothetical protein
MWIDDAALFSFETSANGGVLLLRSKISSIDLDCGYKV